MSRTIAKLLLTSRLCRRIAACVFLSIVAIETAILVPSHHQFERKLISELTDSGLGQVMVLLGSKERRSLDDFSDYAELLSRRPPCSARPCTARTAVRSVRTANR